MAIMLLGAVGELDEVEAISKLCAESHPRSAASAFTTRTRLLASMTLSVWGAEVPPPGAGFEIAMVTVPMAETALAGIKTVALVAGGYMFGCVATPLTSTVEEVRKLLPVRVRVKLGAPAVTVPGKMLLRTGTGFTTWNVSTFDG